MTKYLLLKHYRGSLEPLACVPMDQWTPDEVEAHITYMGDFAQKLVGTGEFVDGQALSPDGMWVRHDGEGTPGPGANRSMSGWKCARSSRTP